MTADSRIGQDWALAPQDITHVLYHANCPDGFGAAWAAWRALGDKAQYVPVKHHAPPPALPAEARVAVIDFAYPREESLKLKAAVRDLVIIDHHESAQKTLADLDFTYFDMNRSGARLSWDFFHWGTPPPGLIEYVEDRDLWRWRLPDSKEVTNALSSYPMDFAVWSDIAHDMTRLVQEGRGITRFQQRMVEDIVRDAFMGEVDQVQVPMVNCASFLKSDVGHRLLEIYPDAPFVAIYNDSKGLRKWSLRAGDAANVATISARFGGGGHPRAAGFAQPIVQGPVNPEPGGS